LLVAFRAKARPALDGGWVPREGNTSKNNDVKRVLQAIQQLSQNGTFAGPALYQPAVEAELMLVERGFRVMNVEIVGDAYSIASNYLRRTGAIADTFATNERLLEIIVEMYQRGEFNKIRLANKAIARFEAVELV
jgi:hypothetical protein